ncbi:MAG: lipid IV(A) 3-deoxy-D-manno-octulosonic acid transferase [Arenimonas sp.]
MSLTFLQRISLAVYSLVMYALTPLTLIHLVSRGFNQREYFKRWSERFAMYRAPAMAPCIWLHAVSVGEVNAITPLLQSLRRDYPGTPLLITTTTPTGSARVKALFGDQVQHVYLPYDTPGAVNYFLNYFQPKIAIIMETEIWPNLFAEVGKRHIPLLIVNARLSERSMRGYRVIACLMNIAMRSVTQVAAQSSADLLRYQKLGIKPSQGQVTGNLKFDVELPVQLSEQAKQWRAAWGSRPAWIAASTHPEEEIAVIAAHKKIREQYPNALLLWAPRHPERFDSVMELVNEQQWRVSNRVVHRQPNIDSDVFIINTLGELLAFYACADVAFVGGSFQAIGGHNLLEPASLAIPSVVGPHTFNFVGITQLLLDVGAVQQLENPEQLPEAILRFIHDKKLAQQCGNAGRKRIERERGALERTLKLIELYLKVEVGESL